MSLLRLGGNGKLLLGGQELKPAGRNIAVLVDTSGSMSGNKLSQVKAGTVDFALSVIPKGYAVAVIVFGDRGAVVCDPTADSGALTRKIAGLSVGIVGGSTHLGNGLAVAAKVPSLSHVLVVTDGQANDSEKALAVAAGLKSAGVEILTLGTRDADAAFLARLASRPDMSVSVNDSGIRSAMGQAGHLLLTNGANTPAFGRKP
jgi:Mg-chelatase subunit ChlD